MKVVLACLLTLLALPSGGLGQSLTERLDELGAQPCEVGELTCVTIGVPMDHRANAPGRMLDITFAVSLATDESAGLLLYAVGGPGGSGLQVADDYLAAFDAELTERMDIAFFDQRGIGASAPFACPVAQARLDSARFSLSDPEGAILEARAYARDCVAETGESDLVPFLGTDQAIRDAEAFRLAVGAEKVWVYGESYGTQFAQTYAALFPTSVAGVIVDGVVDLGLSFEEFYASYTSGSEMLLQTLFRTCDADTSCSAATGGDAAGVYDRLAERLAAHAIPLTFPLPDGTTEDRELTEAMLETNVFYALYGPGDRASFLRMLAAAGQGNLLPMLRLSYTNLGLDPITLEPVEDPSWFGAAYYGVTCADYPAEAATPEEAERRILADAESMAAKLPRLMRYYFAERLVCANWPVHAPEPPPVFMGGDFPVVVLTSDSDPITPEAMAWSVADRTGGSIIVMRGGPHVIWGRGLACPDVTVAALLFDGVLPPAESVCHQDFTDPLVPLTLQSDAERDDPALIMQALETELYQSPELGGWWGDEDLGVGCDFGGSFRASATDTGTRYTFSSCAFWPGVVLHGNAVETSMDDAGDGFVAELAVSGRNRGRLSWHHDTWAGTEVLSGSWNGTPLRLPRP